MFFFIEIQSQRANTHWNYPVLMHQC